MVKERLHVTDSSCRKDATGKVVVGKNGIKHTWKKYVINEENKWDHVVSSNVKEGPADCVMISEVIASLKKMKA